MKLDQTKKHATVGRARAEEGVMDGDPVAFDAIPVSFEYSDEEFTQLLPLVRMAFKLLEKDHLGTRATVCKMLKDDRGDMLVRLLQDWETMARDFSSMSKLLAVAHTRALISFCVVAPNHPALDDLNLLVLDKEAAAA